MFRILWIHKFYLSTIYVEWLLGYVTNVCIVFKENAKLFTRVALLFYIPTSSVWDPVFLYPYQDLELSLFNANVFLVLVLCFAFTSMIHFELILYKVWVLGLGLFFAYEYPMF